MNRFSSLIILFAITQICLAQKKVQNAKPVKNVAPIEKIIPIPNKEETNVPFKLLDLAPSRLVPKDIMSKAENMGASVSGNDFKIPTSTEKGYMYDAFALYGVKHETYLVNLNGNIEIIPASTRLITTTKNNFKILVDQCIDQIEWAKCSNIRIIDNLGKTLDADLSKYYYALNMQTNLYNSENNTYVIVHSNFDTENIITETGKTFFATKVSNISFIIPGFITYEEGGKEKLMELSTKRNIDISNYESIEGLRLNKLIVGKQKGKYILFNPTDNKILFESEKTINEVYGTFSEVNPKNYFILGGNENLTLVDITGRKILEDEYKRFLFYFEGNTIVVENKLGKQNYYDLEKKAFVYRAFYNSISTEGAFDLVKYDNYCEVYDPKSYALLYGENKNVKGFSPEGEYAVVKYNDYCEVYDSKTNTLVYGQNKNIKNFSSLGNMSVITKQINQNNATKRDIFDKSSRSLIYEDIVGLQGVTNTTSYFVLNKDDNPEQKYSIIDKNGKIIIPEIIIPNYINYNIDKKIFYLSKRMNGKATECYDKTGVKIKCP